MLAVVVLGNGSQPVVEGATPQGGTLTDDAEVTAVVEGDGGVETAPAVDSLSPHSQRKLRKDSPKPESTSVA